MASPCPRSSAPMPGWAPSVSTKVKIGRPNFSASCITRSALRYPSGCGIPKFRYTRCFASRAFCCPITTTSSPWKRAIPATIAGSSANPRSVNLAPVGKNPLHVVERVRSLRMPRQLGLFPRSITRMDLPTERVHPFVQLLHLPPRFIVLTGHRLQLLDLLFDPSQLLLRFESYFHLPAVPISGVPVRFNHGEQKFRSRHHLRPVPGRLSRWLLGRCFPAFRTFHPPPQSIDDANTPASAQFFHPRNEVAVRLHIIALGFHHHHEIPGAFHIK